jgi:uncharacterized protein YndB with AHSA1/START domain
MTETVIHSSFQLDRVYTAPPSRVFAAFRDPAARRRWYVEGEGWEIDEYVFAFEVGGREGGRFRYEGGPDITNDTVYQDIVPDRRIVFAYNMTVGGKRISASLATIELVPEGDGTRLTFTEQGAWLDGTDQTANRKEGMRGLLEKLAEEIRRPR